MKPYKFEPYLKTTLWGGYQIAPFKGIFTAQPNIGESWEISGVPGHESRAIERGLIDDVDVGLTLTELIDKYKGLLVGQKVYKKYGNQFPLLVKFIDSRQDLSVQVHPDDKLAMERHGCQGKTEMWYIIKSDVGAKIYSGLKKSITPDEYEQLANAPVPETAPDGLPSSSHSPMQDVIATHEAHDGDLFFLPAGRLHAIGAGNFLAEIQETSDITYRVFDFNRTDTNGNKRQLHTELAAGTIRFTDVVTGCNANVTSGNTVLLRSPKFRVCRQEISGSQALTLPHDSFLTATCISGYAEIAAHDGSQAITIAQGESLLIAACAKQVTITGEATLITASR